MRQITLRLMRLLAILILPLTIGLAAQASAVDVFPACRGTAKSTEVCNNIAHSNSGTNPIITALEVAITIVSAIIGVAAVIVIVVSGLSFMTANGDAQAIARARSSIIFALVGIIIAVFAQVFVAFILNKL